MGRKKTTSGILKKIGVQKRDENFFIKENCVSPEVSMLFMIFVLVLSLKTMGTIFELALRTHLCIVE